VPAHAVPSGAEHLNNGWRIRKAALCALADQYGVTHIVLDEDLLGLACPQSRELYRDSHYAVHALTGP